MKKFFKLLPLLFTVLLSSCISLEEANGFILSPTRDSEIISSIEDISSSNELPYEPINYNSSEGSEIIIDSSSSVSSEILDDDIDFASLTNQITTDTIRAVVTIEVLCYNKNIFDNITTYQESIGSGVIFKQTDQGYYALTNNHVTVKTNGFNYIRYTVVDYLGYEHNATLIDGNPNYDLSIIYFEKGTKPLKIINTIINDELERGDNVISLGQPLGQRNAITYGLVTYYSVPGPIEDAEPYQTNVEFEVLIHSAKIAHGSSGGPLLNTKLEIVGINYAGGASDASGFSSVSAAIPGYRVNEYLDSIASLI